MDELDSKQQGAVDRALAHPGFGLYFEPRVGKTRTAMAIVAGHCPRRLLVIAPKNVIGAGIWDEAAARPETQVINFEQVLNKRIRRGLYRWLEQEYPNQSMVLVDEGHKIKRRTSKISKAVRQMGKRAGYRLLLTGTPIAQGLHDNWALFDFIDPTVFGDWEDFRDRYCIMHGKWKSKVIGYKRPKEFARLMHSRSDRVTLGEVSKRPLKVIRRPEVLKRSLVLDRHYQELEKDLITATRRIRVRAPLVITLALRLQQLTGGFLSDGETLERVDMVKEVKLRQILAERHPWKQERQNATVICCRFLHEIDQVILPICKRMGLRTRVIRGGEPLDRPFKEDVAIVQVQSGLGIDLSRADTIIFYSWDYSFINFEQMRFRVLSRERTQVRYIFLMIADSIDGLIYEAITKKKKLSDVVCDHYRTRSSYERSTRKGIGRSEERDETNRRQRRH